MQFVLGIKIGVPRSFTKCIFLTHVLLLSLSIWFVKVVINLMQIMIYVTNWLAVLLPILMIKILEVIAKIVYSREFLLVNCSVCLVFLKSDW